MAYDHIEQLLSRRGEKVAAFLTVENIVGMAVFCVPVFLAADLDLFVRAAAIIMGIVLGLLLTADNHGMMVCERVLWRVRGFSQSVNATIAPSDLPGTRNYAPTHYVLRRDAAVRASRRHRHLATEPIVRARAARPLSNALAVETSHADSAA